MTVIAFTSAKGSPGVSTVVLGLGAVWTQAQPERRVLVVEADPAGGEAAVGLLQGRVDASRGLLALAALRGVDPVTSLWGQLVALDEAQRHLVVDAPDDALAPQHADVVARPHEAGGVRVELKQAGVGQSCAQRANILYSAILREFASARVPDRTSGGPAIQ